VLRINTNLEIHWELAGKYTTKLQHTTVAARINLLLQDSADE
jgi:hypothetical protein